MTAPQHDLRNPNDVNDQLVAAVIAKDSRAVQACLQDGADPNTPGSDGLPLLCAAVGGFDHETASALTDSGADSDAVLPDGTTPLLRAVDLGSPALVGAVLGKDPRLRIAEAERKRLLDLARDWYETGEAEELRRRTGASGPATRRLVKDDEHTDIEEVSLGGLTVRAGHSGVLTDLERAFGLLPPVAELVARTVPHPDELHANWSTVSYALAFRKSPQAWSDLAALRHHPPVLAGSWHASALARAACSAVNAGGRPTACGRPARPGPARRTAMGCPGEARCPFGTPARAAEQASHHP
ncbi:ankyrin repeat domain-containing protein [Streptomyces sp. NPDC058755]|uniref:ankyrin repeat domain-containing protein n=1 Tax=Streptomyces sp. NPDC058755 TaxID=3346624 RepID=UPI00369C7844